MATTSAATRVIKIANPGKASSLQNDAAIHQLVTWSRISEPVLVACNGGELSVPTAPPRIRVPQYHRMLSPSDDFWKTSGVQPTDAILSERIPPLPMAIRERVVDAVLPLHTLRRKMDVLAHPENRNCLLRLYLGRRDTEPKSPTTKGYRLNDFPLTVNDMEVLGLDVIGYARAMAEMLALLHWRVGVDAADVEFVLAGSESKDGLGVWLLDFDQCKVFEDGEGAAETLAKDFWDNDPYYPRPSSHDPRDKLLWTVFKEEYLAVSAWVSSSKSPGRFIRCLEEGKKGPTDV